MTSTIRLSGTPQRQYACKRVMEAPEGFTVKIAEETRSDEQNRLMWPLIKDMQDQIDDMRPFSGHDVKLRFLNALGKEMRFLPELEGGGMFPVGQRSSTLNKQQFSALLELMFMHGAKHNVQWSMKSKAVLDQHTSTGKAGRA